jgi:hypothetical protein
MPEHASRFAAALYDQFEDEHRIADWGGDELFTRMPRPRAVDDAPAPRFRPYLAASEPTQAESTARASTSAARASASAARASRSSESAARPSESAPRTSASAARASGSSASAAQRPDAARRPTERSLALVELPEDRPRAEAPTPRERRRAAGTAEQAMLERTERLGLSVVDPLQEPAYRWDESGALIEPPPTGRQTRVITGHPGRAPRPLPIVRAERRRSRRMPAEWIGARPERIVGWAFALGLLLILIAITTADAATL